MEITIKVTGFSAIELVTELAYYLRTNNYPRFDADKIRFESRSNGGAMEFLISELFAMKFTYSPKRVRLSDNVYYKDELHEMGCIWIEVDGHTYFMDK